MRATQRIQVRRIGGAAVAGTQVVESVAVIQVAAPCRLSAGRESAGGGQSGGDVPDRLRRSVGTGTGAGDAAAGRVEQHGRDRGSGPGDHECGFGGDGAVSFEVAGKAVEPGEGGCRQCDGQVRTASLPGRASRCASAFTVADGIGGHGIWLVSADRALRVLCRWRCHGAGRWVRVGCDSLIGKGCRAGSGSAGRSVGVGVDGRSGYRPGKWLSGV